MSVKNASETKYRDFHVTMREPSVAREEERRVANMRPGEKKREAISTSELFEPTRKQLNWRAERGIVESERALALSYPRPQTRSPTTRAENDRVSA
jgi:hypothetical protein